MNVNVHWWFHLEANEMWQRATLGVAVIADERAVAQQVLREVTGWLRLAPLAGLIRIEEEWL
jgi:uncharacterized protein YlxP (DUF503 family)